MAIKRARAIGYGYVIADEDGRIQLGTLRPNRSQCWDAFNPYFPFTDEAKREKKRVMKMGFRAVPVFLRELEKHRGRGNE